ncbi:hypothetical protein G6L37_01655 [Agrobacterium rubi]|nr:hypothetical protein [Agrobacterium rubi]NTF24099.1 hypothetical protein [Agrobacterium rubi]
MERLAIETNSMRYRYCTAVMSHHLTFSSITNGNFKEDASGSSIRPIQIAFLIPFHATQAFPMINYKNFSFF